MHKRLTLPALLAKKDVFVEWPLGNGLAEAEEMAALAKKQGVKTYVGLQARVQPFIVKVVEPNLLTSHPVFIILYQSY